MSETAHQRKQQAIIRVAESRLSAVHAVDSVRVCSKRWTAALPVSPKIILHMATGVGVGSVLLSTVLGARKSSRKAQKVAAQPWRSLLAQIAAAALVPFVQGYLRRRASDASPFGEICASINRFFAK